MSIGLRMAGTAQPRPIDPALVGWWKMDGNLTDSSGKGNNATVGAGSAAYAAGKFGQAWDNDETRFVDCGNDASLQITNNLTVSFWVNATSPSGGIVGKTQTTGNQRGWVIEPDRFRVFQSGTLSPGDILTFDTLNGAGWTHVSVIFQSGYMAVYLNGVLDASKTSTDVTTLHNSTEPLYIGQYGVAGTPSDRRVLGQIDNVMIYNRALAPAEIRYVYESGRPVLL